MKIHSAFTIGLLLAALLGACGKDSGDIKPSVSSQIPENTTQDEEPWKPLDVCGENAEFSVGAYFLKDTLGIDIDNFENYPKDIKCFVENAAQCDHFSGEQGDTDEERLQEIILAMKKYCGDALAQMPIVKKKYEQDTRINKKVLTICETINTDDNQKSGFHVDATCALMNLQCPNDVSECLKR